MPNASNVLIFFVSFDSRYSSGGLFLPHVTCILSLISWISRIFVYVIYRILSRQFNFIGYFHLRLIRFFIYPKAILYVWSQYQFFFCHTRIRMLNVKCAVDSRKKFHWNDTIHWIIFRWRMFHKMSEQFSCANGRVSLLLKAVSISNWLYVKHSF